MSIVDSGRSLARRLHLPPVTRAGRFIRAFNRNLAACTWEPHPRFNVFCQFDRSFYLSRRAEFLHKYRVFWSVSRTVRPCRIVELGTASGSSADAYLSASPSAEYVGFDWHESPWWRAAKDEETGERWYPRPVLDALFRERGYRWQFHDVDLRGLKELPVAGDFVVVDAAHDFENEYADLKLALTAEPAWIWVDDDEAECAEALSRFLEENRARVAFTHHIPYVCGGGRIVRLR